MVNKRYRQDHGNILDVIDLLLDLPASSSEVERGFSQLKLLKTSFRSSLSEKHLNNSLAIKMLSKPISEYDPSEAIDFWNTSGLCVRRPVFKDKSRAKSDRKVASSIVELGVVQNVTTAAAKGPQNLQEVATQPVAAELSEPSNSVASQAFADISQSVSESATQSESMDTQSNDAQPMAVEELQNLAHISPNDDDSPCESDYDSGLESDLNEDQIDNLVQLYS